MTEFDPQRKWQLPLAVHKALGAADQIGSYLVGPLDIDGTGSTSECVELDLRRANNLHPIHVLQQLVELRGLHRRVTRFIFLQLQSRGQHAVVIGDLMHHTLQCREPDWSTIFDWDPVQAARSRRKFLTEIAGTDKYVCRSTSHIRRRGSSRPTAHGSGTSLCDKQYLLGSLGHMSDRSL
jgi:hypothetical protein